MTKTNITTETYDIGEHFFMDVVTKDDVYEGWFYHRDYCTKRFMVGLPKEVQTYEEALELLEDAIDDNIKWYTEEVIHKGW